VTVKTNYDKTAWYEENGGVTLPALVRSRLGGKGLVWSHENREAEEAVKCKVQRKTGGDVKRE